MNVKSEEIINFANKVCRMCFSGIISLTEYVMQLQWKWSGKMLTRLLTKLS